MSTSVLLQELEFPQSTRGAAAGPEVLNNSADLPSEHS